MLSPSREAAPSPAATDADATTKKTEYKDKDMKSVNDTDAITNFKPNFNAYILDAHMKQLAIADVIGAKRDYRDVAMALLTNDFLNVADVSLEVRAYLVETVLPCVIMSLEKLLKEADKRGLVDSFEKNSSGAQAMDSVAVAAETARGGGGLVVAQPDLARDSMFDPVNWLGQHLYRNNPRYSNFGSANYSSSSNNPYHQDLTALTKILRTNLFEMEITQKMRRRAKEREMQMKVEQIARAELQKIEDNRNMFTGLLTTVFKRWTGKFWRLDSGTLMRNEIKEAFKSIRTSSKIQADDSVMEKVHTLIQQFSISIAAAEQYRLNPTEDEVRLPPEYVTVDRWDQTQFVNAMMILTEGFNWTIDHLLTFLQALTSYIDEAANRLNTIFDNLFFCPTITVPDAEAMASDPMLYDEVWKSMLNDIIESVEVDLLDVASVNLKKNLQDYCMHIITLAQYGVDLDGPAETYVNSEPSVSSQAAADANDQPELALRLKSEEDFKKILKVMTGVCGLTSVTRFMMALKDLDLGDKMIQALTRKASLRYERRLSSMGINSNNSNASNKLSILSGKRKFEERVRMITDVLLLFDEFGEGKISAKHYNSLVLAETANGLVYNEIAIPEDLCRVSGVGEERWIDLGIAAEAVAKKSEHLSVAVLFDCCIQLRSAFETSQTRKNATVALLAETKGKAPNRLEIQRRALEEIRSVISNRSLCVADAANLSLNAVTKALKALHPDHQVIGRLTLAEKTVTKSPTVAEMMGPESPISPADDPNIETVLRVIAASDELEQHAGILGTTLSSINGFEGRVMDIIQPLKIDDGLSDLVSVSLLSPGLTPTAVTRFLGVPFLNVHHKPMGVIGLTLSGKDDGGFVEADIKFVQTCSATMFSTFERINARAKTITLAESSMVWAKSRTGEYVDVKLYLNEPDYWGHKYEPRFFEVFNPEEAPEGALSPSSPYMMPIKTKVMEVDSKSVMHNKLAAAVQAREITTLKDPDGKVETFLPVTDTDGHVVAIMIIQLKEGAKINALSEEDLSDVKRSLMILESCINHVQKEKFGQETTVEALSGENIDEESRVKMFFGKMMLLSARDLLSKLDNRSMSELRSYKHPPQTIHRIIKAVLYLFGHAPKEVKKWADAIKLVNMELLRHMISYDPTAIQKKIKFKRCSKVLKLIPHGDVRKRGSLPATNMYEWLLVTLELRQRAVEARQRRSDVFLSTTSAEIDGETVEGEDDGEEESGGNPLSRSNSLEFLQERDTRPASSGVVKSRPASTGVRLNPAPPPKK